MHHRKGRQGEDKKERERKSVILIKGEVDIGREKYIESERVKWHMR